MSFLYNRVCFIILIIIVLIPRCHNFVLGNHLINFLLDIQSDVRSANLLPEPMKGSIKPIKSIVFFPFGQEEKIDQIKTFCYCLFSFFCITLCFKPATKIHIPNEHLKFKNFIAQYIFTSSGYDTVKLIGKLSIWKKVLSDHARTLLSHLVSIGTIFLIPFFGIIRLLSTFIIITIQLLFKWFKEHKYQILLAGIVIIQIISIPHFRPNADVHNARYEPVIHGTYGPKPVHSVMFREVWEYGWDLVQIWWCRGQAISGDQVPI